MYRFFKQSKTITLLVISSLVLTGCGKELVTPETKPFAITTQSVKNFQTIGSVITKSGKVVSASDIVVNSQVAGRIVAINKDIGSPVSKWSIVITLDDVGQNYTFAYERAKNNLTIAQAGSAITDATTTKSLSDADLNLANANNQYNSTTADIAQQTKKSDYDYNNNNPLITGSTAAQTLEKLQSDLLKAELDYSARNASDTQTTENFVLTTNNILSDFKNLGTDIIQETDKILWVTTSQRNANDAFEWYLWAKDIRTKYNAEKAFIDASAAYDSIKMVESSSITTGTANSILAQLTQQSKNLTALLDAMDVLLVNSISSAGNYPPSQLDGQIALINGLQARNQWQQASFTATRNMIATFFGTYSTTQAALAQQIKSLKSQIALSQKAIADGTYNSAIAYERTKISTTTSLSGADIALQLAQNNASTLTKTALSNRQSAGGQLAQAQLAVNEAQNTLSKLGVRSPIRWTIKDIFVDKGQDITPSTPLFALADEWSQQVEIAIWPDEAAAIRLWDTVQVVVNKVIYSGSVVASSEIGDRVGNYKVIVQILTTTVLLGQKAQVIIPIYNDQLLLPINSISIVDQNVGVLSLRNGTGVINRTIQLGGVVGNFIEVITPLSPNDLIIISDITNYDPTQMQATINKR